MFFQVKLRFGYQASIKVELPNKVGLLFAEKACASQITYNEICRI